MRFGSGFCPTPIARGKPSLQDRDGLWQLAQAREPLPEKIGSKNSMRPRSALAMVYGFSGGNGLKLGRRYFAFKNSSCEAGTCATGSVAWARPDANPAASRTAKPHNPSANAHQVAGDRFMTVRPRKFFPRIVMVSGLRGFMSAIARSNRRGQRLRFAHGFGQNDRDGRAFAGTAGDVQAAPMQPREHLAQGQSQADAFVFA